MLDFTRLKRRTQKLIAHLGDILPVANDCLLCQFSTNSKQLVCQHCLQDLDTLPLGYDVLLHNPSASAALHHNFIDGITAVASYQWPFVTVVPQLKFHQTIQHAKWLGQLMSLQLQFTPWQQVDVVCPIPLHTKRLAARGYNQSELLCRFICNLAPVQHLLQRTKYTKAQSSLSRKGRLQNVKDAFYCNKQVNGKRILLIDDVITTGTTVNEAAKELKSKGATAVFVAAVAIRFKD